jgi:preprotein translocase subunit SecD
VNSTAYDVDGDGYDDLVLAFRKRDTQLPCGFSDATLTGETGSGRTISGSATVRVGQQVINLKSGALPADLEYVEERTIGASLGQASVRAGVLASIGGLALVTLFMVAYYRRTGLNALVSIALNLLILMALAAYIPVTMTLPGIAGLILTIGMGVDSTVFIASAIAISLSKQKLLPKSESV